MNVKTLSAALALIATSAAQAGTVVDIEVLARPIVRQSCQAIGIKARTTLKGVKTKNFAYALETKVQNAS